MMPIDHHTRALKQAAASAVLMFITLIATPHANAELGRVFFTPAERKALDHPPPAPTPAPIMEVATAPAAPPQRIDGLVRLSNGEITLWLDGTAGPLPAGLRAAPFPSLELIPRATPHQRLRTGDRWQASAEEKPAPTRHDTDTAGTP